MKNLLFILLFLPFVSEGQTIFGIKASGNISYTSGMWSRQSVSGGVFLEHVLTKHLSLREEGLFSQDGYSEEKYFRPEILPSGDTSFYIVGLKRIQYQINSIEIPVTLLYKIGNKIQPYIGAGVSGKFTVLSRSKINVSPQEEYYEDITTAGFNFTIVNYLGVETTIKETPVHVEIRHSLGLLDMVNNKKISMASLMIGFKI